MPYHFRYDKHSMSLPWRPIAFLATAMFLSFFPSGCTGTPIMNTTNCSPHDGFAGFLLLAGAVILVLGGIIQSILNRKT